MPAEGHTRRKLFEVHEATKSPIAQEALLRIQALYAIEAEITGKSAAERQAERQARSIPLLAALKTWMEAQRRRASGKTSLGKALRYALGRWDALARYAEDGRLAIDNNVAERLLRGIAVSRKNFLFIGSDQGGERAAILYTLIETAKLNGLHPEAYLAQVINRLARGHLASKLSELLPWNYKPALPPKPTRRENQTSTVKMGLRLPSAYRACQRHTAGRLISAWRTTSATANPSPDNNTIRAR